AAPILLESPRRCAIRKNFPARFPAVGNCAGQVGSVQVAFGHDPYLSPLAGEVKAVPHAIALRSRGWVGRGMDRRVNLRIKSGDGNDAKQMSAGRGVTALPYDAACGGMVRNACITWFAMCRLLEYPILWATLGRITNWRSPLGSCR